MWSLNHRVVANQNERVNMELQ